MRLYLVQHGLAKSELEDPERSLSARGSQDVNKVARFVRDLDLRVAAIRHSGKTRAAQTADLLSDAVSSSSGVIRTAGLSPNDPVKPLVEEIKQMSDDLMVVGHLPFLGKLASSLITDSESASIVAFQQGGIVCLERDESAAWRLRWMVTPDILQ